jgi:signal transduction histidine kinase
MRERTRAMAVTMGQVAAESPQQLLGWFCRSLRDALRVKSVGIWILEGIKPTSEIDGELRLADPDISHLAALTCKTESRALTPRDVRSREALDSLRSIGAALVASLNHQQIKGLLIVGRSIRNRDLTDEENSAAVLLAEQLAVTLHAGVVHADRLAAERRAMQNEKLGTLGMVASSIAHEVKNPLSSIRTIATLLAEEMSPDDPKRQDVTIIRDEIDRLATTTSRLLKFARPTNGVSATRVLPAESLSTTLHLLGYLARQKKVTIAADIAENLPPFTADEEALREISTNLIANAIEAARSEVRVKASALNCIVTLEITNDGTPIAPQVRERLFEPFVTTRADGTGLGLYIVGRRVRELGGEIRCDLPADEGTRFTVELPAAESRADDSASNENPT